ncbi:MAG: hypothetical protein BGO77_04515 [Caedibacter sp. 37-49]|nr:MAG: hypothetical protein BGO77_04515 [Caedibacter sp. 37-49]
MVSCNDIVNVLKDKVNKTSVDLSTLKYDKPLRAQGIDSLDVSLLMFSLEEKYSITIPTSKIGELLSVEDFQNYINGELEKQKAAS